MNLDELTFGQIKQLQCLIGKPENCECPYTIGKAYFIRTVTMYYTGRLEKVTSSELVLSSAAWIADTKRYYDTLKTGEFNEVEPIIGPVIIGRGAIVDAVEWPNNLPDKQI